MRWWRSDDHGGDTRVVLLLLNYEESFLWRWLELRHCTRQNCRVKSEGCGAVNISFAICPTTALLFELTIFTARVMRTCPRVPRSLRPSLFLLLLTYSYIFPSGKTETNEWRPLPVVASIAYAREYKERGTHKKRLRRLRFRQFLKAYYRAAWYYDDETKEEEAEGT